MDSQLTPMQEALLQAFFRHEQRFFLTGGAALAGFHLGHRTTQDLDLFVVQANLLDEAETALRAAAGDLGATLERVRTAPEFRRWLVRGRGEGVVVDLVFDRSAQGPWPKLRVGAVHIDPPQEILANKLCAILSRAEVRDLVDTLLLERSGLKIEDALPLANAKDGGLTPAQLAWILSQIRIGDDAKVPGGVTVAELRSFLADLAARLTRLAFPG